MEPQLKPIPIGNDRSQWPSGPETIDSGALQNNVLRNTYWLLALSMLPTIIGAYAGMSVQFRRALQDFADHGAAFDVRRDVRHAVRRLRAEEQRLGRAGDLRLHVRRRRDARADAAVRGAASRTVDSSSRWRAA